MLGAVCATAAVAMPATALAHDHPGDDDAPVGTVSAFSSGALTIAMTDGSSVTGSVDDRTDIECIPSGWLKDGERGRRKARAAHNGDDHHGRRSRSDHRGHRDHGWHRGHHRPFDCGASALTAGTSVREADLKVTASGLVFDDVELIKERAAG
jgi:hypothetical protein